MRVRNVVGALALAGVIGLGLPAGVAAQEQVPAQQPAVEVTDELLERFVAVYPEVVNVAQVAQTQLAAVETPEEAQEIQAEAQAQITAVIQEGDLSPEEYEAVVMELNNDPERRAQFEAMLAEEQGDPIP